jgi:hypothetical protein
MGEAGLRLRRSHRARRHGTASVNAAFGPCPCLSGRAGPGPTLDGGAHPAGHSGCCGRLQHSSQPSREPCDRPMTSAAPHRTSPSASPTQPPTTSAKPPRTAVRVRAEIAVRHRLVLASAAAGSSVRRLRSSDGAFPAGTPVSGRRLRRRRRRCKWRAGPAAAPSAARNTGAPVRSPDAQVDSPGSARREQMVTTSPPLRIIVTVR